MAGKLKKIQNLISNMGWRYVAFRAQHEVLRRTGLLRRRFPAAPPHHEYATLEQWKQVSAKFFFDSKETLSIPRSPQPELKARVEAIKRGEFLLFHSSVAQLGVDYDWVTNPDTGYKYDAHKHWTLIADLSKEAGDIKYVWEKSRFSYLYDIIRYDYHFQEDCSGMVFADILSWIDANPVNCGPNYRCSQEMSLRVLNWLFALQYYRNAPALTPEVFSKMQYALYWHLRHIFDNIHFSRIAVRNNHAITETLTLYLAGIFFPFFPGAATWKQKGKQWLEEEIAYQVYPDGTFLQFSMNYHRVVAQLLTWGITLTEKNGERLNEVVYARARKSLEFLRACMIEENGWLPNYGANDGALFFNLSSSQFRDYRPQLQALGQALGMDLGFNRLSEDAAWYGLPQRPLQTWAPAMGLHQFTDGGYFTIREPDTLTFIKCGSYKDRPSQADNLHLDVWYKGENLLVDAGSYKYNTDDETIRYFSGTRGHNTVMLDGKDQMQKGGRFIWFFWSQRKNATLAEVDGAYVFTGAVQAFMHLAPGIIHTRTVIKPKGKPHWAVTDQVEGVPIGTKMEQLWHIPLDLAAKVTITATDESKTALQPATGIGWQSSLYGHKHEVQEVVFSSEGTAVLTTIEVKW